MNEQVLQEKITDLVMRFGDAGVFLGMFLESSIIPIPSEVVIIGAGALGISMASILIFGSLGATCGAMAGYALGRYAAMPVILKLGRFVFIKPHHINKAEAFAKKYGAWSVFIGRLLPVVPFKVFSIAAGIIKVPFIPFVASTLLGVLPRMYVLALFGATIVKYKKPAIIILISVVLIFFALRLTKIFYNGRETQE
jgi:membrane protein DedA with SNARE-associated domain